MSKKSIGNFFGIVSVLTVIICAIIFFIQRGPDADAYFFIVTSVILSVTGLISAVLTLLISRNITLFITGLLGNSVVLIFTFFLFLAMGIGEP